jgi:putative DNA primase/helicase
MLAKVKRKKKKKDLKHLVEQAKDDWPNTFEALYMEQTRFGTVFELSDTGNALRFAYNNGGIVRFHIGLQKFGMWNGHKWDFSEEVDGVIYQRAIKTVREIKHELENRNKPFLTATQKEIRKWGRESENRIPRLLNAAKNLLAVSADQFDKNPHLLNCADSIVNLKTKEVIYHNEDIDFCRQAMCTKICPVEYNPWMLSDEAVSEGISSDRFDIFLEWICSERQSVKRFLQLVLGCAIVGENLSERLIFLVGKTNSGKTTLIESVKSVIGDYAKTARPSTFLKQTQISSSARSDIKRLSDARLVVVPEMPKNRPLDTPLLKAMSGGSTVTFRDLYKSEEERRFPCTILLEGNDWPQIDSKELPMWRRVLGIEVLESLLPDEVDISIKQNLLNNEKDRQVILAWLVEGAHQYLSKGLKIPESIQRSTKGYQKEMNPLKAFLEGYCEFRVDCCVSVSSLRLAYIDYCKEQKVRPESPQAFNKELAKRGCSPDKQGRNRFRVWKGLKLR